MDSKDNTRDVRDFLAGRRARITPQQAGLPAYGGNRRVPGLRREEVALLAGVSVDYYVRLERGHLRGVSDSVLHALADALQLDEAERAHLRDLAANANRGQRREAREERPLRAGVLRVLDAISDTPAFVWNRRLDLVAANRLGYALYAPLFDAPDPDRPVNIARFKFLDPAARAFFADWDVSIHNTAALLRMGTGQAPDDEQLSELIMELQDGSPEFKRMWAQHEVTLHWNGTKHFHHPVVGDLDLPFETLILPAHPDLLLTVLTPEPGTTAAHQVRRLADWSAAHAPGPDVPTAGAARP
ncbi:MULTISPECIES: helix-turn-helix transcriptional regulator [unclassified Streptomyces]|uniref:helix-turn-helix domain-containing protein n=1 Tax=unclassified Streptomyces TaxID=2593676 RepID=UPI002E2A0E00|nr:helix-turn-helix transcriptional regulator [Streptomyces sp. NBC_00208]